jgi:hypothetical protein
MTKALKQRILWFGPIVLLWSMIVLPSCSHAVWGSFDDGANLAIAQAGARAALIINGGRVCPVQSLHNWLLYQIGGINPTIWYIAQSIEFLLSALLIYIAVGYLSKCWASGALAAAVMLTSAPIAENAYTISKAEPRVALFFSLVFLMVTLILGRTLFAVTTRLRVMLQLLSVLGFLLAVTLAVYSKESAIAVAAMGVAGVLASLVQLSDPYRKKAVWTFFMVSIVSITIVLSLLFIRLRALKVMENAYTTFTPNLNVILSNIAAYVRQSPDVLFVIFACFLFGVARLWNTWRDRGEVRNGRYDAAAVMGWSSMATALAYFSILLVWKFNSNYYMLPVAACASLATGYFWASRGDRRKDHRLLRWFGAILLITVGVTRFYSIPYLHFIATAQRGSDEIGDAVARIGLESNLKYHRIIDIAMPSFVEQPYQRNLLYRALSAPHFSWVGGGELLQQYPEALKQLFGNTNPSPLQDSPPNEDDLFLVGSSSYPFDIELRGIGPYVTTRSASDQLVKRFEERTGLSMSELQTWHKEWTVYQPWTLRKAKLEFRSVVFRCKTALAYKLDWEGRFGDGWIGKEAALHITENPKTPPGQIRLRTEAYPWALPIWVTLAGEKVLKVELTNEHRDETVSIDKLLPARQGTIRIIASKTWVLKDFQPNSDETRALAVRVDYEPVNLNRDDRDLSWRLLEMRLGAASSTLANPPTRRDPSHPFLEFRGDMQSLAGIPELRVLHKGAVLSDIRPPDGAIFTSTFALKPVIEGCKSEHCPIEFEANTTFNPKEPGQSGDDRDLSWQPYEIKLVNSQGDK